MKLEVDLARPHPVTTPGRHGGSTSIPPEALLADDPELHLATADMDAWADAHPCHCTGGLCECDD